jgi:hypothetical protein
VRILRCQPQRVSCIRQLHQTVASGSGIRQLQQSQRGNTTVIR